MATIREIAEKAGFSQATVSRILNDDLVLGEGDHPSEDSEHQH